MRAYLTELDRHFAQRLRKFSKPLLLIANKTEGGGGGGPRKPTLGFGEPVAISAEHGEGIADLYHAMTAFVPPRTGG